LEITPGSSPSVPTQRVGDGVELLLHGFIGARLSVLQQRDEQKRNDRRHRVDHQLPSVHAGQHPQRRHPQHDHQHANREKPTLRNPLAGVRSEPIEAVSISSTE
jgi:hypothetical protein